MRGLMRAAGPAAAPSASPAAQAFATTGWWEHGAGCHGGEAAALGLRYGPCQVRLADLRAGPLVHTRHFIRSHFLETWLTERTVTKKTMRDWADRRTARVADPRKPLTEADKSHQKEVGEWLASTHLLHCGELRVRTRV